MKHNHTIFYNYLWTYQHLHDRQTYIMEIIEMSFVIIQIEIKIELKKVCEQTDFKLLGLICLKYSIRVMPQIFF